MLRKGEPLLDLTEQSFRSLALGALAEPPTSSTPSPELDSSFLPAFLRSELDLGSSPPHRTAPMQPPVGTGGAGLPEDLAREVEAVSMQLSSSRLSFMRPLPPVLAPDSIWKEEGDVPTHPPPSALEDPELLSEQYVALKEGLSKALKTPLLPAERQQLIKQLHDAPQRALCFGMSPSKLPLLVEKNAGIAYELLMRLKDTPSFAEYLSVLVNMDLESQRASLHSLEVFNKLLSSVDISQEMVDLYVHNTLRACDLMGSRDKATQLRVVRLVCVFLSKLLRIREMQVGCRARGWACCLPLLARCPDARLTPSLRCDFDCSTCTWRSRRGSSRLENCRRRPRSSHSSGHSAALARRRTERKEADSPFLRGRVGYRYRCRAAPVAQGERGPPCWPAGRARDVTVRAQERCVAIQADPANRFTLRLRPRSR